MYRVPFSSSNFSKTVSYSSSIEPLYLGKSRKQVSLSKYDRLILVCVNLDSHEGSFSIRLARTAIINMITGKVKEYGTQAQWSPNFFGHAPHSVKKFLEHAPPLELPKQRCSGSAPPATHPEGSSCTPPTLETTALAKLGF